MTPIEEIRAERQRQIEVEGFTAEHDDRHTTEDLTEAALAYEAHAMGAAVYDQRGIPTSWPWEAQWWKPKGKRRDLVRAGALALAEQERWERDGMPAQALPDMILERVLAELQALDGGHG